MASDRLANVGWPSGCGIRASVPHLAEAFDAALVIGGLPTDLSGVAARSEASGLLRRGAERPRLRPAASAERSLAAASPVGSGVYGAGGCRQW